MKKSLLAAALALSATTAFAGEHDHHEDEHREHGAHVHGQVDLDIAQEGNTLLMLINTPSANVMSFEHAPKTHEQEEELEATVAKLRAGETLFVPSAAAKCQLVKADVDSELLHSDSDSHDEHHADEHHEDEHKHHADEHHEDEHEHHADEHHEDSHSDFAVSYEFVCEQSNALQQIDAQWFDVFPSTEQINVQVISDQGQQGVTLTAEKPQLEL